MEQIIIISIKWVHFKSGSKSSEYMQIKSHGVRPHVNHFYIRIYQDEHIWVKYFTKWRNLFKSCICKHLPNKFNLQLVSSWLTCVPARCLVSNFSTEGAPKWHKIHTEFHEDALRYQTAKLHTARRKALAFKAKDNSIVKRGLSRWAQNGNC